jgi:hypothetical protein
MRRLPLLWAMGLFYLFYLLLYVPHSVLDAFPGWALMWTLFLVSLVFAVLSALNLKANNLFAVTLAVSLFFVFSIFRIFLLALDDR